MNQDTRKYDFHRSAPSIGAVFTPQHWTNWLLGQHHVVKAWLDGATVLDPTCGQGQFLLSLMASGIKRGVPAEELPVGRLFGIEREARFLQTFLCKAESELGVVFPNDNLLCVDMLLAPPKIKADILVGNPPWQNFADLPSDYKELIKPLFIEYGLVVDTRLLLLGGSRIDIAALVIAKAIGDYLKPYGDAYFFLPLSTLLNDGAHAGFRRFRVKGTNFALASLYDFDGLSVFPGVATRYGAAHFRRDIPQQYPVICHRWSHGGWLKNWTSPLFHEDAPLSILNSIDDLRKMQSISRIHLAYRARPRQGVNTCGANGALIFSNVRKVDEYLAEVVSRDFGTIKLPSRFLYPLLEKEIFSNPNACPQKYVLLPYQEGSGKPVSESEATAYPQLWDYLKKAEHTLRYRKGKFIGRWIANGFWWASLGVGPYCFTPYKIAWSSYGQSHFEPKIFGSYNGKAWQGNQALHAYIPCISEEEAEQILLELRKPEIELYLQSFRMNGTRSWAQPGKLSKLFDLTL